MHSLFLPLLALASFTSLACAGSVSPMHLTVSSHGGKTVYKGMTDASGAFTTPALAPGNYVLLFHSKSTPKGGPFDLVVSGGEKEVIANSVPGGRFTGGGVAMRVKIEKEVGLRGQVSRAGVKSASGSAAATPVPRNGETKENGMRVKYVDGKKFVWVESDIAAGASGHWAPADSMEARNAPRNGRAKAAPSQSGDR